MTLRPDFLIVGMQRSGTLWVSAVLNGHPEIASFPTLPFEGPKGEERVGKVHFFNTLASIEQGNLENFARPLSDYLTKYGEVFADLVPLAQTLPKQEFYKVMVERYSNLCDEQRGNKNIVGESTPAYAFHLGFIDSLYPDIKKICVFRDPKDRVTSWHFSLVSKRRKEEGPITEAFALEYIEERVKKEYEALLRYNGSLYCTSYEGMTESQLKTIEGLCSYLGFEAPPDIAREMLTKGSFKEMTKRHSRGHGRERGEEGSWRQDLQDPGNTLYDVNPMRKGIVGDWKNYISMELANVIDASIAPLERGVLEKYHVRTS